MFDADTQSSAASPIRPRDTRLTAEHLAFVSDYVLRRSGIVLGTAKRYLLEDRLATLAGELALPDAGALVEQLRCDQSGALGCRVVDLMTTNETSFFRDVHPFEALEQHVFPEFLAAHGASRGIRIWCGACSTGQEPYSIALLIRERFPELAAGRTRILATDISRTVVERARQGRFTSMEVSRGLPAKLLDTYFTKEGDLWRMREDVRGMVEFRPMNLLDDWCHAASYDIIFLRYVLIYFGSQSKTGILSRLHTALAPDGYLFLGSSESPMALGDQFAPVRMGSSVCFQPKAL